MIERAELYKICNEKNFAAAGSEGLIYIDPNSGKFIKERLLSLTTLSPSKRDLCEGRIYDPLAERKRKLIHTIANHALSSTEHNLTHQYDKKSSVTFKVSFAHIEQASRNSESSFSVMPEVQGSPSTSEIDVLALAESLQDFGIEVDVRGQNIFVGESGEITILEAIGGMHPEILKYASNLDQISQKAVIKELAKLYILDGCEKFPTVNPFYNLPASDQEQSSNSQFWESIQHKYNSFIQHRVNMFKLSSFNSGLRSEGKPSVGMLEYFIIKEDLESLRAWSFLGKQFTPQAFDWQNGSNCSAYGIDPNTYQLFSEEREKLHTAFSRIKAYAPKGKDIPVAVRANLLELITKISTRL